MACLIDHSNIMSESTLIKFPYCEWFTYGLLDWSQ